MKKGGKSDCMSQEAGYMRFLRRGEGFSGIWVRDTETESQRDGTMNICVNRRRLSERRRLEMETMLGKEQDIVQRRVAIVR